VGLSQVSKDWRITFFSNAARIWSQGLRAELGEVAKAIEHFLEFRRLRNVTPVIQRNFSNGSSLAEDDGIPSCMR